MTSNSGNVGAPGTFAPASEIPGVDVMIADG
jgi:hypothetical protein